MSFRLTAIIILFYAVTESLQNCILSNTPTNRYQMFRYSRFSFFRKYIYCQNETITSNFYTKVEPLLKKELIVWLEINSTSSPEIGSGAFRNLKALTDLRMNGIGIHVIQSGAFDGLYNLEKLSLRNNRIVEIQENYFNNVTKLIELDLSSNNIAKISGKSFDQLKYLRSLNLKGNFLTELPSTVFQNLNRIDILDLSFNKIITLDNKLFAKCLLLKTLFLDNNDLNSFDANVFINNTALKEVYLDNNFITQIDSMLFSSNLNVFNISYNMIQTLSFGNYTNIKSLDLKSNGITNLRKFPFKNLMVTELYLDDNNLGLDRIEENIFNNLLSLFTISLSNNHLKQLPTNLLINHKNLNNVNISNNLLTSNNFLKFPIMTTTLDLSYNNFDSNLDVTYLENLEMLNISFNKLSELRFDFLKGLGQLRTLRLDNNKIVNINTGVFKEAKNLRYLDLSHNEISEIDVGAFAGLNGLFSLNLSYNNLKYLKNGIFHNFRSLQILNLAYNSLSYPNVESELLHFAFLKQVGLAGNGWSCDLLIKITRKIKGLRIIDVAHYNVTNVDGVSCEYEKDEAAALINVETNYFAVVNSKLFVNNTLLILILLIFVIKILLKIRWTILRHKKKNTLLGARSEQELSL